MGEHTTPWKIEITTTLCHVIDADGETVTAFSDDDAEFWNGIVKAVNNHEAMVDKLAKVAAWLERLAVAAERSSVTCRFESMREAYDTDAQNYRKTLADILPVLEAARGGRKSP